LLISAIATLCLAFKIIMIIYDLHMHINYKKINHLNTGFC
jgi:hypothetical protein